MSDSTVNSHIAGPHRPIRTLVVCGLVSWLLYAGVAWLSQRFSLGTPGIERPIVEVLLLLAAVFTVYLLAIRAAVRAADRREVSAVILVFAVAFRLLLLFTEPIQEVDIYRYLWDGQVSRHGINPFRYSPQQVLQASHVRRANSVPHSRKPSAEGYGRTHVPSDLFRLVELRETSPAIKKILSRVHFTELPTVYPPVSQAVFALAALTTPHDANVDTHVIVMKTWIVGFDLATILILLGLLKLAAKPVGWSVAYAWCPLVLKEFANSGHLDAIAVCLTTLAVYIVLRSGVCRENPASADQRKSRFLFALNLGAFAALGLAVGAKLFPVVLAPLLLVSTARRFGWCRAVGASSVFVIVSTVVCWPMLGRHYVESSGQHKPVDVSNSSPSSPVPSSPSHADQIDATQHDPNTGLQAFFSRWKMNDFLFLILIENLTPDEDASYEQPAWFVVTPNKWRLTLTERLADSIPISLHHSHIPFLVARTVTAMLFIVIAGWFSWRVLKDNDVTRWLEAVFLTLAWFFLLLPTQNPWYWIWALPFVPFARGRAWLAVSGLVLVYYLRFWLAYHWSDSPVPPSVYRGKLFFDYVVTWFEFGPWFTWLVCSTIWRNVIGHTDRPS